MTSSGDYNLSSLMNRDPGPGPSGTTTFSLFVDGEHRNLECPVCRKEALAPLIVCHVGHAICDSCFMKFPRCPTCRSKYATALISSNDVKCLHSPCPSICKVGNLKDHLDVCEFRPVICTTCPARVHIEFAEYPAHLLRHRCSHGELPELSKVCFAISWMSNGQFKDKLWTPYPFRQGDIEATFLLNMELRASVFSIWVSAMLPEADASQYYAELKIGEELEYNANPQNYMNWTVNIGTVRTTSEQIQDSKEFGLSVPMQSILAFLRIPDRELGAVFMFVGFEIRKNDAFGNLPGGQPNLDEPLIRHVGGGDGRGGPECDLAPVYNQLREREQEIIHLKTELKESVDRLKEQHKKLRVDMERIEDRLNYRPCCSLM